MTFSLVLMLYLGGLEHRFTVDYGMSAGDCLQAVIDNPHVQLRCEKE